jgi:hypothetical protein
MNKTVEKVNILVFGIDADNYRDQINRILREYENEKQWNEGTGTALAVLLHCKEGSGMNYNIKNIVLKSIRRPHVYISCNPYLSTSVKKLQKLFLKSNIIPNVIMKSDTKSYKRSREEKRDEQDEQDKEDKQDLDQIDTVFSNLGYDVMNMIFDYAPLTLRGELMANKDMKNHATITDHDGKLLVFYNTPRGKINVYDVMTRHRLKLLNIKQPNAPIVDYAIGNINGNIFTQGKSDNFRLINTKGELVTEFDNIETLSMNRFFKISNDLMGCYTNAGVYVSDMNTGKSISQFSNGYLYTATHIKGTDNIVMYSVVVQPDGDNSDNGDNGDNGDEDQSEDEPVDKHCITVWNFKTLEIVSTIDVPIIGGYNTFYKMWSPHKNEFCLHMGHTEFMTHTWRDSNKLGEYTTSLGDKKYAMSLPGNGILEYKPDKNQTEVYLTYDGGESKLLITLDLNTTSRNVVHAAFIKEENALVISNNKKLFFFE